MVTKLQRRFCRSKVFRRAVLGLIEEETGCVAGYRRIWHNGFVFVFEQLPEGQIKVLLYQFLQCSDITPADRAEIMSLLRLSSTALTKRQRRQIMQSLEK